MNNTLVIGTGGCGNKLMNVFISLLNNRDELHASYDGIFVNSNKNEMEILDNCDLQRNALVINGDGTGRNASKAKKSIALDRVKVMNYFARIIDKYQSAIIMTSLDGGFGNGSIDIITKILKQLNPDIKIFLLGASAKLKSKKISLENTLSLYEDIKELMEIGQIDSYMFIDNDKMDDEDEFNIRTMSLFLDSLELDSHKTKGLVGVIENLKIAKEDLCKRGIAVIDKDGNENLVRASSNLPKLLTLSVAGANVYDLVKHKIFICTKDEF